MINQTIRISNVIPNSIVDGLGFRYVIFSQGCKHNCKGCFNPTTHDFNGGVEVSTAQILNEIEGNLELIRGITLSGGDPFEQAQSFLVLIREIKERFPHLNFWCYSGYTIDDLMKDEIKFQLLKEIDVLVDGKFEIDLKDIKLKFKGSSNQRVIDVQKTLKANQVILYNLD